MTDRPSTAVAVDIWRKALEAIAADGCTMRSMTCGTVKPCDERLAGLGLKQWEGWCRACIARAALATWRSRVPLEEDAAFTNTLRINGGQAAPVIAAGIDAHLFGFPTEAVPGEQRRGPGHPGGAVTSPVGTGPTREPTLLEDVDAILEFSRVNFDVPCDDDHCTSCAPWMRLRTAAQRLREVHASALTELAKAERHELECLAAMNRGILFATVQVNGGPLGSPTQEVAPAGDKSEPREATPACGNLYENARTILARQQRDLTPEEIAGIGASSGTPEARVCETWCGEWPAFANKAASYWRKKDDRKAAFCSADCADAGRPLHPPGTQPTERGAK